MNQRHWLNIAEYMAIAASIGGTIVTILTQQIMLTTTPLTLALILNVINRQKQLTKVRRFPEPDKLIEIYDDLISVNEDYRFHKLEIQEKIDTSEKNQTTLRSFLEEIKQAWENESKLIYNKLSVLENDQSNAQNNELHQLYFSLSQRIDTITDTITLDSTAYQHQQGEIKDKLEYFNHNQTLLKSLLEQIKQAWDNELKLIYNKLSVVENHQSDAKKIAELNQLYVSMTERLTKLEEVIKTIKEPLINHQEPVSSVRQPYPNVSSKYSREEVYTPRQRQDRQSENDHHFGKMDNFKKIDQLFQNLEIDQFLQDLNSFSNGVTIEQSLSELDLALLQEIAIYLENMTDKIRHYHQDHGASLAEAEIIAKYYLQMSDQAKSVKTKQDLKALIQSIEALKQQVSRYNHDSYKYRWSRGLEKEVLDKLKTIKL